MSDLRAKAEAIAADLLVYVDREVVDGGDRIRIYDHKKYIYEMSFDEMIEIIHKHLLELEDDK